MDQQRLSSNNLSGLFNIVGKIYSLEGVKDFIRDAYNGDDVNIENDDIDTCSKVVCNKCHHTLKRWSTAYKKYKVFISKNRRSAREFTNGLKLPSLAENNAVHLIEDCVCREANLQGEQSSSDSSMDISLADGAGQAGQGYSF